MPTAIFTIGRSGLTASRRSLELTAQNIANAANPDYSRRNLTQGELVMTGTIGTNPQDSLGGVRPGIIERAESALVQRQARDASSALSAAETEFLALREAESALETSGVFSGIVDFEAALTRLQNNPLEPALRLSAVEAARKMAGNFRIANGTLANARSLVQAEASAETLTVNELARELAAINADLVGAREGTAGRAALLDARDKALRGLAEEFGIQSTINANGTADVSLAGTPPVALVTGGAAQAVSVSFAADGTASFAVGATTFAPTGGAMAGRASALADMVSVQTGLRPSPGCYKKALSRKIFRCCLPTVPRQRPSSSLPTLTWPCVWPISTNSIPTPRRMDSIPVRLSTVFVSTHALVSTITTPASVMAAIACPKTPNSYWPTIVMCHKT